jgi:hypothetical protein
MEIVGTPMGSGTTAKAVAAQAHIACDVKPRSGVLQLKKRHVEEVTRLPTKGMATACWASIVAKRPSRETAPALVFRPLQAANKEI